MKNKLLFYLLVGILFWGCGDDNEDTNNFITLADNIEIVALDYNIKKNGLTLESYTNCQDTTEICFCGRVDNKLWVGCYDKKTKNQILEWQDTKNLETSVALNIGYGEIKNFEIKNFLITGRPYLINKEELIFIIWGCDSDETGQQHIVSSNLYFIKNNKLLANYNSYTNYDSDFFYRITPWYEGVMANYNNEPIYTCYGSNGQSLYDVKSSIYVSFYPVNYYEYININPYNPPIARKNLQTGETIWENTSVSMALPNLSRIDDTTLVKNTTEWIYTVKYTTIEGSKLVKTAKIDINTGEIEIEDTNQ
ncbi:MAG: hypothetical protein FWF54_02000 [Candidatus Azobacteroides sp.]|nr:hypothetical protein [Candidatus Azobacteroides sp.]